MDPISTARYGMMNASAQLASAASQVAAGPASDTDYASDAVNMIEAEQGFKANVDVIKVADAMWQSLLNLQAVTPGDHQPG